MKMLGMSEIFDMLTGYASEYCDDKFCFNSEELADIRDEIIKLQD